MRPLAGSPAAVPQPGAGGTACGLDPSAGRCDPPDRLGQQPGVGRVGHVRRHHGGIGAQPIGAQQLGIGGLRQKRLVAPDDCCGAAPGGELHQRRRVRDLAIDRDPAEPPPGDRVADLTAQALKAQPVAELQEHHPQVGLHRRRRPPDLRVEERHERGEEPRVVQQRIDPRQFFRQPQHLRWKDRLPQAHIDRSRPQHQAPQHLPLPAEEP